MASVNKKTGIEILTLTEAEREAVLEKVKADINAMTVDDAPTHMAMGFGKKAYGESAREAMDSLMIMIEEEAHLN